MLQDNSDVFPIPRKDNMHLINKGVDLFVEKIKYMLHSVGGELFEDFDEDGYRDGYIQQIGRVAESDAYDLLEFLKYRDNTIMISFRIALTQMMEIIGGLVTQ